MPTFRALMGPIIASLVALALFLVIYESPGLDPRLAAPKFHFWLVSGTSLLAFALAVLVGFAGARSGDARVAYLGAGFAGLAGFFSLHGLATPGFLIGRSEVTGVAAELSLMSLAIWMYLAAYRRPNDEGAGMVRTLLVWVLFLVTVVTVGLARPDLARFIPVDDDPLRWGVTTLVIVLLLAAGARFLEGYRLSRSALHLVMLYLVGLLAVSQVIMVMGVVFQLSWWIYHALLLIAVVSMLVTVAGQLQAGTLSIGLGSLLTDDAERRLAYGLRPEVRALVVATEAKDRYTAGHMQRVAGFAVRLGRAAGLGPEDLRALAQAAVVHDVGKIEVPDAVLNKPGTLLEQEIDLIRSHPDVGARIGEALGMHRRELEVIRHHHERWDGSGYPDGLSGEEIPKLARVLSIADVYDALTSDRSYRDAWSPEAARQHISREAGRSFDPELARAWLDMNSGSQLEAGREAQPLKGMLGVQGAE
ncbi:MAG TPA: HD-GYP domain-containing protein [Trueperaceae bacterium]